MGGCLELRLNRPPTRPDELLGRHPGAGALRLHLSVRGGQCAGGAKDLSHLAVPGTFWKNPQFLLSVWRPQEGEMFPMPCSVLVSLLQKPRHRHRNRKPHLAIGFYVFRVGGILGHVASLGHAGVSSCPFFLFPVLFTIHVCLPTGLGAIPGSVPRNMRSRIGHLLALGIGFFTCKMGTVMSMQRAE